MAKYFRKFIFIFAVISFNCKAQKLEFYFKKIDSLNKAKENFKEKISNIESEIKKFEIKISQENLLSENTEFGKIKLIIKDEILIKNFPSLQSANIGKIPKNAEIDVLDYKDEFLKILYQNEIRFTYAPIFPKNDSIQNKIKRIVTKENLLKFTKMKNSKRPKNSQRLRKKEIICKRR